MREYINNILEKNDNYCFTFFQHEFSFLFHRIYIYKTRLVEYFKIMFRQKKGEESARTCQEKIGLLFLLFVMQLLAFKCYQESK